MALRISIHDANLPMVRVNRDEMNRFIESYKELLAACESLLGHTYQRQPYTDLGMLEYKIDQQKIQNQARLAIAKAKGE